MPMTPVTAAVLRARPLTQTPVDERTAIEQEDVLCGAARTTDNTHKLARIQEARRAEKHWRPGGPGGVA